MISADLNIILPEIILALYAMLALLGAVLWHPAALLLLVLWPLQVLRLIPRMGAEAALFTVLGKLPEAMGVGEYYLRRWTRRRAALIEYK